MVFSRNNGSRSGATDFINAKARYLLTSHYCKRMFNIDEGNLLLF